MDRLKVLAKLGITISRGWLGNGPTFARVRVADPDSEAATALGKAGFTLRSLPHKLTLGCVVWDEFGVVVKRVLTAVGSLGSQPISIPSHFLLKPPENQ